MKKNQLIKLFIKLAKISSPSGQEKDMILFVTNWAKQFGLDYFVDKVGNILITNKGTGSPILFSAHMDTVQPGENIKPIITSGIIKSDGKTILGADNKAAIACLLTAIEKYLLKKNKRAFELLFAVKEETGGGIDCFPFKKIKSKQAFIFDSAKPLGGIILRSPYIINFHVKLIGKACHSSTPLKGKNALLTAIRSLSRIKTGELDNKETTINIGLINGGSGINTVPEKVTLSGEIRSYQKKLFDKHLINVKSIFKTAADKNNIKLDFKISSYCPGYNHDDNSMLIKETIKILKNKTKIKIYNYSGVSDANILNSVGITTINLTDGVKNPHTVNEQVKISDLARLKEIIYTFLISYIQ